MTESFKIEVRNQKAASQKVRIVERLYRWTSWSIDQKNTNYEKLEANTIEFNLDVPPEGSKVITYRVVYTW